MSEICILLVEDDAMQRRQMARVLKSEGYRVSECSSGDEALRLLDEVEVTLVLTDMRIPGKDGIFLLKHIRRKHADIRVIIMTGDPHEVFDPQPDALLLKPFTGRQLKELARRLIKQEE